MSDESYSMFFNDQDRKKLTCLEMLDKSLKDSGRKDLKRCISACESEYGDDRISLIKALLKLFIEYWVMTEHGLDFTDTQKGTTK